MGFSAAALVVSTAVSAYSAYSSGQAKSAADKYQAGVAQINQQIAKQSADYAIAAGEVEAQQAGMKTRAQVGETIAQQGAGGLAIGGGSNARVVQSEKEIGAENVGIIRSNAAKRAYGYEVEAVGESAKGNLLTMASSQAKTAGNLGAFSSIVGGVGSVATKWSKAGQVGLLNNGGGEGEAFGVGQPGD